MKSTIFVLLSVAMLLPRPSAAATIRDVDNSDYGIQSFGTACATFSDSSGMNAHCFFSLFSNGDYGFLVGFDTPVSNVEVAFSNANIFDTGLVICSSDPADNNACDSTPTWDLDVSAAGYPNFASLFSSTVTLNSAIFTLNGSIPASHVQGNEVAFLLLCTPNNPEAPAASDCNGVNVSARLRQTTPVPEPGSLLLWGGGAAMLARRFRNRRVR